MQKLPPSFDMSGVLSFERVLQRCECDFEWLVSLASTDVVNLVGDPLRRGPQDAEPQIRNVALVDAFDRMAHEQIHYGRVDAEFGTDGLSIAADHAE